MRVLRQSAIDRELGVQDGFRWRGGDVSRIEGFSDAHYTFFRRYGLEDLRTIVLNSILLFLIVFYVYPLKFMFSYLIDSLLGFGPGMAGVMTRSEARALLLIYGGGFVAMFATLTLLYDHAWRCRDRLELDEVERFDTL
ncbi:MAG TPA: hypothetical protein VFM44_11580, partial [Gemmatimonadota bacterium]|nr:hypothetical protein [Gemmatimonadota bacterium]